MDKTQKFILLVQTGLVTHYAASEQHDHPMWAVDHLARAIDVAPRIPKDRTALEAAEEFLGQCIGGLEQEERAKCPAWLHE